jgi:hypothetical protein
MAKKRVFANVAEISKFMAGNFPNFYKSPNGNNAYQREFWMAFKKSVTSPELIVSIGVTGKLFIEIMDPNSPAEGEETILFQGMVQDEIELEIEIQAVIKKMEVYFETSDIYFAEKKGR